MGIFQILKKLFKSDVEIFSLQLKNMWAKLTSSNPHSYVDKPLTRILYKKTEEQQWPTNSWNYRLRHLFTSKESRFWWYRHKNDCLSFWMRFSTLIARLPVTFSWKPHKVVVMVNEIFEVCNYGKKEHSLPVSLRIHCLWCPYG